MPKFSPMWVQILPSFQILGASLKGTDTVLHFAQFIQSIYSQLPPLEKQNEARVEEPVSSYLFTLSKRVSFILNLLSTIFLLFYYLFLQCLWCFILPLEGYFIFKVVKFISIFLHIIYLLGFEVLKNIRLCGLIEV